MKNIKTFEGFKDWFKSKSDKEEVVVEQPMDDSKIKDIFDDIKSNYDDSKLEFYNHNDVASTYSYRYKVSDNLTLEINDYRCDLSIDGGKFEKVKVSKNLLTEIVDFFESKNKGKMRDTPFWLE